MPTLDFSQNNGIDSRDCASKYSETAETHIQSEWSSNLLDRATEVLRHFLIIKVIKYNKMHKQKPCLTRHDFLTLNAP